MFYNIYHPESSVINHDCVLGEYWYGYVGTVEASCLESAFLCSQNDFNDNYAILNTRSTCIGDILYSRKDDLYYIITGHGFKLVDQRDVWPMIYKHY